MAGLTQGDVLAGRFELRRRLGTGGLAEVFAALDKVTGQEVALKVLHSHLAREPEVAERFRRELAVTRGLDHPGIVRVYDLHEAGSASGGSGARPFFTMELLEGETLAERLRRGRLPPEEARRIAREASAALRAAHRAGVVHRDLKPANLFLTRSGEVKLLDFGLARVAGWARLTAQSTVMGTPGYIAPELLGGNGADARADIYSLGATLFEMLTGRHAFPGSDPYEVLRLQRDGAPSPAALAPGVTGQDDALVRRALDPDPERRFLDMGQFLRELSGEAVPSAPPAPPAMTAGAHDVVVHHAPFQGGAIKRVFKALGIKKRFGWGGRLGVMGTNLLASGASRATAEALTAICQEQGVGTALVPHKQRGRIHKFLDRFASRIAGAIGLGAFAWTAWYILNEIYFRFILRPEQAAHTAHQVAPRFEWGILWFIVFGGTLVGGTAFILSWALLGLSAGAPIADLPEGDPAVRRLMEGIARRVERLHEARKNAQPASQMILDELLVACEPLQAAALQLANRAAIIDDPLAGPEAKTLAPGEAAARDQALERLLEMAAALDEALLVAQAKSGKHAEGLLAQLRQETAWARKALPALDSRAGTPSLERVVTAGSAEAAPFAPPAAAVPAPLAAAPPADASPARAQPAVRTRP